MGVDIIILGVAWRRDGQNEAHKMDLARMEGLSKGISDNIRIEARTLAWAGAEKWTGTKNANSLHAVNLLDVDVLVIPGGPHANATQINALGGDIKNQARSHAREYAEARATSELHLISQARRLGMPILALCGGSWRLLESYGGTTIELGSLTTKGRITENAKEVGKLSKRHASPMDQVTALKHDVKIASNSMLHVAIMGNQHKCKPGAIELPKKADLTMAVNSVHWAVAREQSMGGTGQSPAQTYPLVPGDQLEVNARDTGGGRTVEGFESKHGAPTFGLQWHPEYQYDIGDESGQPMWNQRALLYIAKAGQAYRRRRLMTDALDKDPEFRAKSMAKNPEDREGWGTKQS
jgi:gamma-glutamyl-gamma-aminobutyrate hydrolase PuuD